MTLFSLFFSFFKIGAFTWGGGYAMLPLIKREIVEKKKMLTEEEFIEGLSVAQSLPGAIAINTACFVGRKVGGITGSIAAISGAVLPSFLVIMFVASFFLQYRHLEVIQNFFRGATPAIVALIAGGVVDIGKSALDNWEDLIIAFLLFFLVVLLELHPLWIVLIGGMLGMVRRK
ncbi:MAG TPA: chromate transporter [Candidatus Atribacteria bacterium]|nr:chromate transporter [Atribacterota bacterium]HOQ51837.1 chromate transporter [Candidatus Atribacteria bacterium]HQD33339.1 chromate transporter [Candidatus Atribacteria bacterium]